MEASSDSDAQGFNGGTGNEDPNGDGDGEPGGTDTPPEQELEESFRVPVVTGRFVWSANPESGRVALIDADSFEVRSVDAGLEPTFVAAVPGDSEDQQAAVVLNLGSNDASILRVDAEGEVTEVRLPIHAEANTTTVSADGRWAIVWTDARRLAGADVTDGFQDITVLDLFEEASTRLSVGYRPTAVQFDVARGRAYVVTEPGVSEIDLGGETPRAVSLIAVEQSPELSASSDVSLTSDGHYALVRYAEQRVISVLELSSGVQVDVNLSGIVTDLDVSNDGSTCVAVVRDPVGPGPMPQPTADGGTEADAGDLPALDGGLSDAGIDAGSSTGAPEPDAAVPSEDGGVVIPPEPGSEIFVFAPAELFGAADPALAFEHIVVPGERFGSVVISPRADTVMLYTNATESDRLTVVDLEAQTHKTMSLRSPVLAAFASEDGEHGVVLQRPSSAEDVVSRKPGAFSLVPLRAERAPKIVGTDAPPLHVAMAPVGETTRALITVGDPATGIFATHLADLETLQTDPVRLASAPLSTGMVLASEKGFVAQAHPEGRITFVGLSDAAVRTLTGFELAAKVVE
jgi:hypothetical protein